jgi:cytochrome c biogenesis protein CcmG/thiol:disulfide interchange protein DsbE
MNRFLWPLVGFIVLVVLLAVGLTLNPRDVPSPLVGKPAPNFSLPVLAPEAQVRPRGHARQGLAAQRLGVVVRVLPCRSIRCSSNSAKKNIVPVVGLNYKEVRGDGEIDMDEDRCRHRSQAGPRARRSLAEAHGDPYTLSVLDIDGRVGIDYGVYGVPETYVIDKAGIIRMKHTGPDHARRTVQEDPAAGRGARPRSG